VQLSNTSPDRSFERLKLALSHTPPSAPDAPRSPSFTLACHTHEVTLPPMESVCIAIKFHASTLPSELRDILLTLQLSWFESKQVSGKRLG
jgi:hypothetical protein